MEIRKISKSDLEDLARLMVEVFNMPPWNDTWTEETASESLLSLIDAPGFYGNVMVEGTTIIGAIMGNKRLYSTETTYYLYEFFVSDKYRGKGVSKKLYEKTMSELKKEGVSGAFFTTIRNSAAYKFYIKEGAWDLEDSACFYHKF
ncbi:GNAT family N-acetyltransferase [Peptoniphilus duerdenii]|uniref:GNAT family N-acetyltransferase n=1 Tax=Peptoniphilus duerdenii TaxID=507750 RepID=UPI00288BB153|nr:GNAT family N-acetyltransferase [Peptoniphilus duerdenii]